jgi:hypothetical protein
MKLFPLDGGAVLESPVVLAAPAPPDIRTLSFPAFPRAMCPANGASRRERAYAASKAHKKRSNFMGFTEMS